MQVVRIDIAHDLLTLLVDSSVISTEDFKVVLVNDVGHDFTTNPIWVEAKKESDKAYKNLKKIEFNIIHKIK